MQRRLTSVALLGLSLMACGGPQTSESKPPTVDANPANASALSQESQALVGCWQGYQGDEHLEYRFGSDGKTVLNRDLRRQASYLGSYTLTSDKLTLDFGEEPPTYKVQLTPTTLTLLDFPFTYSRAECSED